MKQQRQKKIPTRMCLGCSQMKPKREMIRVVKPKEGEISIDPTGKKSGRGAYICKDVECFNKARKAHRFEKAFSCTISEQVYDEMERELKNGSAE